MEELAHKRTSQKEFWSHAMKILNKVEETLADNIDELTLTYLKTAVREKARADH